MAQIRVEQKRGGMGWLWALIALVVAALVAWYLIVNGSVAVPASTVPDSARTSAAPRATKGEPERVDWTVPASVLGARMSRSAA